MRHAVAEQRAEEVTVTRLMEAVELRRDVKLRLEEAARRR